MSKSFKARKKARTGSKGDSTVTTRAHTAESLAPAVAESLPPPSGDPPADVAALAATATFAEASAEPAHSEGKNADVSGEFKGFFSKPEEEIHLDELRREAPDLHEEAVVAPRRRVDRRAHQVVIGVLGFAAAIGIAGAVMRRATPRASAATTIAAAQPLPPPPVAPPPPAAAAVPAPPPVEPVVAAPASAAVTPTAPEAAVAPAPSAAPVASVAPAAPAADEEESLTGAQLLSKARQAINAGSASKAAAYAKKSIAKGGGGSAYYVLGAAYQTMGSNGAAKSAYGSCAKSGCAEASECASLADGM